MIRCDLVGPVLQRVSGCVDVLLFNPPYVPSPSEEVPAPFYPTSSRGDSGGQCSLDSADFDHGTAIAEEGTPSTTGVSGDEGGTCHGDGLPGGQTAKLSTRDDDSPARQKELAAGAWAGGEDGREVIDRLLPLLPGLLSRPNGVMYMIAVQENDPAGIARLLSHSGFATARVGYRQAANERLHLLRVSWRDNQVLAKKGGRCP